MQSQFTVWETEQTVCCHFWCSKTVAHLHSPRSEVLMLEIHGLLLTKKQLENHLTTCKTSFMDVILHYSTYPHHQRSGLHSNYSQTLQIHCSSSLFLCSSNCRVLPARPYAKPSLYRNLVKVIHIKYIYT